MATLNYTKRLANLQNRKFDKELNESLISKSFGEHLITGSFSIESTEIVPELTPARLICKVSGFCWAFNEKPISNVKLKSAILMKGFFIF